MTGFARRTLESNQNHKNDVNREIEMRERITKTQAGEWSRCGRKGRHSRDKKPGAAADPARAADVVMEAEKPAAEGLTARAAMETVAPEKPAADVVMEAEKPAAEEAPSRSGPGFLALRRRPARRLVMASLLASLLAVAALSSGCATFDGFMEGMNKDGEDAVHIGIFEPMSGEDKDAGNLEIQGIELAYQLYPEVLGKPVKLIYSDNKSDVTIAEDAAKRLVKDKAAVVLGSYTSTLSLVGGDVFEEAQIPAIGITCTNPLVTQINPYYARVCFVDSFQGNAAAKYVYESLNIASAVVLKETENDYASAMAQQFSDKLASLSGDPKAVAHSFDYPKGAADFTEQLKAIRDTGQKVVYFPSDVKDALSVFEAAKGMGLTFIGTDKWESEALLMDKAAEGAVYTAIYDSETQMSDMSSVFLHAYEEKYGSEKKPESAVALGFDAYLVAREAITRAKTATSGGAIMAEMIKIREFPGATGLITLNSDGDPIKPVAINIVKNGEFVHAYTAEPVWGQ